ncbi:protein S100-A1-like [Acipenser ruthenus]|uniref:protein S100-A1-like n=1 Tax=Acipenser ruthenus TaxID=7906 RepID=UPI00145B34D5|nr:protein S100-A1-like [Acipenser ruthenus]
MDKAIKTLVTAFQDSARGKAELGKVEFENLIRTQLSNILTHTKDDEAVADMMRQLDSNKDGKISFKEYLDLIGEVARCLSQHRLSEQH